MTGDLGDVTVPASEFGWNKLHVGGAKGPLTSDELIVAHSVREQTGCTVEVAGSRYESFDLLISSGSLLAGKYEVKRLSRSGKSFDRRFKVGSRSERIYGHHDSVIKAAALEAEDLLECFEWDIAYGVEQLDAMHCAIDDAKHRRHGRKFERFFYDAIASLMAVARPESSPAIDRFLMKQSISADDIIRGFSEISGIFLMAGANYSLVKQDEIARLIAFDSVSVEGVKLRYLGVVPYDTGIKAKDNKVKVKKGKIK